MILGKDDIKAIADEVMGRLVPILESLSSIRSNKEDQHDAFAVRQMLERQIQESRDWIEKKECLDKEIRENSKKLPPELRPVPVQYKSIHGKELVLELIKDPDRWVEIPRLPKQWPSRKKGNPTD